MAFCIDCKIKLSTRGKKTCRCWSCYKSHVGKNRMYHKAPPVVNGKRDGQKYNEYMRVYNRIAIQKLKDECYQLLGGKKCKLCGYMDERALCFDHTNGGGTKERKTIRGGSLGILRSIKRNLFKYRVLCWNCNWIAHIERRSNKLA